MSGSFITKNRLQSGKTGRRKGESRPPAGENRFTKKVKKKTKQTLRAQLTLAVSKRKRIFAGQTKQAPLDSKTVRRQKERSKPGRTSISE